MPNRILRDWTKSDAIDNLSIGAEVFFTRLIMKADDLGCYYAKSKILKADLFPLKDFTEKQISGWLEECRKARIITCYTVQGKDYLQIIDFGQRLRQMVGRFPLPPEISEFATPSIDGQVSDDGRLETKRNEVETESEEEAETNSKEIADEPLVTVWPTFEDFWLAYGKKVDKPKCEKKWKKITQEAREKIMDHVPRYVIATPEIQYRKNPLTYLNGEAWNDEIVTRNGNSKKGNVASIFEGAARTYNSGHGSG